jgi:hypothetical protein
MSTSSARLQFNFSGHAIGAAAYFYALDGQTVDHAIPALGASALPVSGGVSKSAASDYVYAVDQPRPRKLFEVQRIESLATGRHLGDAFETEVQSEIESVHVVEKLHIDLVQLHMKARRAADAAAPAVSTNGFRLEGVRLGNVEARIVLDDEPLSYAGSMEQLAAFYRQQSADYRQKNAWRFRTRPDSPELEPHGGQYSFSLVRELQLTGPDEEMKSMTVEGYSIKWVGFGRIVLGEVAVKPGERQLAMARLIMGCDAEGDGTIGEGRSNGTIGG